MKRKITIVLLALSMIMTIMPSWKIEAASKLDYVSLGDSMTNGLGLSGYDKEDGTAVNGFLQKAKAAYPNQLAKHYNWNLTQLATSSFRAEDVYALLTYESSNKGAVEFDSSKWKITGPVGNSDIEFDGYFAEAVVGRCEDNDGGVGFQSGISTFKGTTYYDGVAWVADQYQYAVSNADVISLALGANNFGTFLSMTLMNQLSEQFGLNMGGLDYGITEKDLEDRIDELDSKLAKEALELRNELEEVLSLGGLTKLDSILPANIIEFADTMVLYGTYSFVGYMLGYQGVLEYIQNNNPDADIIMLGLNNTLHDLKIDLTGKGFPIIDFGKFFDLIYRAANMCASELADDYDELNIYYVEADDEDVEIIYDALKPDSDGNVNWTGYEVAKSRLIDGMQSEIEMIKSQTKSNMSDEEALELLLGMAHQVEALNIPATLAYMRQDTSDKELYEEGLNNVLFLSLRFMAASGIGCHPSIKGHEAMKTAIIKAYDEEDLKDIYEDLESFAYIVIDILKDMVDDLKDFNILDMIKIKESDDDLIKVTYDAGEKHQYEKIYILQYKRGKYILVDTVRADREGKVTFEGEESKEYILVTELPKDTLGPEAPEAIKNWWIYEDEQWVFYQNNKPKEYTWVADIHNDWYYAGKDGVMLTNSWIARDASGDIWYYVGSDGAMVRDTWAEGYYIDANGEWHQ